MSTTVDTVLLQGDPSLFQGWRPWLSLYGVRLRSTACRPDKQAHLLSLVEAKLGDDLLLQVLQRLPVSALGAVQCVCLQWRRVGCAPTLWRAACLEAFQSHDLATNCRLLKQSYQSCWRTMYLDRGHLRFDGVYVARNTYVRMGAVEWRVKHAVHLVAYYRYLRFMPDGTILYRTSPDPVAKVARSLLHPSRRRQEAGGGGPQHGRFKLQDDGTVLLALRFDHTASTEIRMRCTLRSTVRGANNRLDVQSIVSWDREDRTAVPLAADFGEEEEGAEEIEGVERRSHRRGLAPFSFVPWDRCASSPLNLPVEKMDYFLAG